MFRWPITRSVQLFVFAKLVQDDSCSKQKESDKYWLYLHGYRCWAWRLPLSKMSVQRQVSWRRMWSEELHLLSPWDNLQTRCKICKWSTILTLPPMDYSGKKGCCVTSQMATGNFGRQNCNFEWIFVLAVRFRKGLELPSVPNALLF